MLLNQSEKCNYNPNLGWVNKIPKISHKHREKQSLKIPNDMDEINAAISLDERKKIEKKCYKKKIRIGLG